MSSIQDILRFRRESKEDYYSVLGCDPSSTQEQILAEYKVRARQLHPDKHVRRKKAGGAGEGQEEAEEDKEEDGQQQDCKEFQLLQEVGST